jgi:hypothetical protein
MLAHTISGGSAVSLIFRNYFEPSSAKAMMLSSVTGLLKNPPPVDVITTYCLPSRP